MFKRARALRDPVTITLDGVELVAERGEPLAVSLLANGIGTIARSSKLHRPRGPYCLRGGCDGCLSRVNGEPNVMTCLCAASAGDAIETQNVLGTRRADLLRMTDWFFPTGLDHHQILAGIPGISDIMLTVARQIGGLGKLPTEGGPTPPVRRIDAEVVVLGGGLAGLVAASTLARAGHEVTLIDDGVALGGALLGARALHDELRAAYPLDGVTVMQPAVAAGIFFGELLVVDAAGSAILQAEALVLATGAHDGVLAAPGNDLPGVLSARAVARLLDAGLEPVGPVAVVGSGYWADAVQRQLEGRPCLSIAPEDLVAIGGSSAVKHVDLRQGGAERRERVSVVAIAAPGAPAFELAEQAGAKTRFDPASGYAVIVDETGRAAEKLWAVGECTGLPFEPELLKAQAARVAESLHALLTAV